MRKIETRRFERRITADGGDDTPFTIGKIILEEKWEIMPKWYQSDELLSRKIIKIKMINKDGDVINSKK